MGVSVGRSRFIQRFDCINTEGSVLSLGLRRLRLLPELFTPLPPAGLVEVRLPPDVLVLLQTHIEDCAGFIASAPELGNGMHAMTGLKAENLSGTTEGREGDERKGDRARGEEGKR